jgi:catalase
MSENQNETPDPKDGFGTGVTGAGSSADSGRAPAESADTITTRQGHPITDNQNVHTVGNRGPTTLENYQFLEKITHFDRERIPERVVHARGAGAHGYFEACGTAGGEPVSRYTRAKLFQEKRRRGSRSPESKRPHERFRRTGRFNRYRRSRAAG